MNIDVWDSAINTGVSRCGSLIEMLYGVNVTYCLISNHFMHTAACPK